MNTIWFRDLGFHSNPFSIKPAAFHDQVVGYDKVVDDVSFGILNNKVILLEGDYGSGKSSILRRVLNDFGGKKQVIYYSCSRMDARLDVKSLLNGRYGVIGKWFDMKPKDMILLLDEAQILSSKDFEALYSYYQEGYLKSIVLVGKAIKKGEMTNGLKNQMQEVLLNELNEENALNVVKKRTGDLSLLPDPIVRKLYNISDGNVRLLLKNCEEVCKRAVETGRKKVTEEFLRQVFPDKVAAPMKVQIKEKKPVTKKVVKKKVASKEKKEAPKKEEKKVYKPDEYKDMVESSAEEMLSKPTDEIFGDEQYY